MLSTMFILIYYILHYLVITVIVVITVVYTTLLPAKGQYKIVSFTVCSGIYVAPCIKHICGTHNNYIIPIAQ